MSISPAPGEGVAPVPSPPSPVPVSGGGQSSGSAVEAALTDREAGKWGLSFRGKACGGLRMFLSRSCRFMGSGLGPGGCFEHMDLLTSHAANPSDGTLMSTAQDVDTKGTTGFHTKLCSNPNVYILSDTISCLTFLCLLSHKQNEYIFLKGCFQDWMR